tara:strand:+ start:182 stop:541 length:360 start_codon:yes stop_codon:yes gene_type:complete
MMNATLDQPNTKNAYFNPYTRKAKFRRLRPITVEEPLKPYADFQQLKMAKVKAEKLKPTKNPVAQKPKPFIQLQGEWLAKAGFTISKDCLIEVYKGMLVITLDEPINPSERKRFDTIDN